MNGDVAVDATGDLRAIGEIAHLMQNVHSAVVALHPLDEDELDLDLFHNSLLDGGVVDGLVRQNTILGVGEIPDEDVSTLLALHIALIGLNVSDHEEGSAHRAFGTVESPLVVFIDPRLHSEPPCS